jgi:hypothetical protein
MRSSGQRPYSAVQQKTRLFPLLIVGAIIGGFVLLLGMANDDWVVISFPSAPWSNDPAWPMFEARLWSVMLVGLSLGGIGAWILALISRARLTRRNRDSEARVRALEEELEKTNRLLSATRKSR